jgi:hypothetical protein
MPYYDGANLVTVTKTNMVRQSALWFYKNVSCDNTAPSNLRSSARWITQSCAMISVSLDVFC